MKIVDRIIKEDEAVTRDNISAVCSELRDHMNRFFSRFDRRTSREIVRQRYLRFRKY